MRAPKGLSGAYAVAIGDPAGRTASKSQQLVFYRTAAFEWVQQLQYPDADAAAPDVYERDPLLVSFRHRSSARLLGLASLDVSSADVVAELDGLISLAAFASSSSALNTTELAVVGSLKADCSYLSDSQYGALHTVAGPSAAGWIWQTPRTLDTTTSGSSCAYDHILTRGSWSGGIVAGSVRALDLALQLGIDEATASTLSSQMPVEMRVRF